MTSKTDIPKNRAFALRILSRFLDEYREQKPDLRFPSPTLSVDEDGKIVTAVARDVHGQTIELEATISVVGVNTDATFTIRVNTQGDTSRLRGIANQDVCGAITYQVLASITN